MTWKLFHKLFGWDYVLYSPEGSRIVLRVKKCPMGRPYVVRHGDILFLRTDGTFKNSSHTGYLPLTWEFDQ